MKGHQVKTFLIVSAVALSLSASIPTVFAQTASGAASTNTTTGSTATSDTDPAKGSTIPEANKDSKPPQQK